MPARKSKQVIAAAIVPIAAAKIIADRAAERDSADGEMTLVKVSQMANILFDIELTAAQVAKLVMLIKLVRSENGDHNQDDYVDMAGYAGLANAHVEAGE